MGQKLKMRGELLNVWHAAQYEKCKKTNIQTVNCPTVAHTLCTNFHLFAYCGKFHIFAWFLRLIIHNF